MGIFLAVLAILIIVVIACNWNTKPASEEAAELSQKQQLIENSIGVAVSSGFTVSRKIEAEDLGFLLAVDDTGKRWMLAQPIGSAPKIYSFRDLLSFDLIQNGNQIISGNDGKAAVGAVLFGAAGAVVGASAKKKVSDVCNDLHIELNVNDLDSPLIKLPFIEQQMAVNSPLYKIRSELARKVMAIMSYIKANAEQPTQKTLEQPQPDICEEIEKLHALKEKGILAEEEFTKKKKSLLGI